MAKVDEITWTEQDKELVRKLRAEERKRREARDTHSRPEKRALTTE